MSRRQTVPRQWLVADHRLGDDLWTAVRKLPRGGGVLFLYRELPKQERWTLFARLQRVARRRGLVIADEAAGDAARVHALRELREALLAGAPLMFLSPMFATRSHPHWAPMRRMRAAALVRLSPVPVIALGGMDARRFASIEGLGFSGWAGIHAYGH